ncbi:Uncharacterised protein [Chryseobacterium nakagawai]|uniref:Uncharacterized protein n=1 Tax=Chryseobacterium nakagawai TaxID=1241982 RepID=A0AAD0YNB8_CHRNA|nr:hypothetical protein [Chryseobacterium nakagawai]AZA93037.1 hypothetical protein EG343_21755 [Chryseobacterium nakagawai]VEH19670.1 Uncharacterised protein [Chryseobacterium nakagawai]
MKKPKYDAVVAYALSALGIQSLPVGEEGQLDLSAEQENILRNDFPGDNYETFVVRANNYLKAEATQVAEEKAHKESEKNKVNNILSGALDEGEDPEADPEKTAEKVVSKVKKQGAVIDKLMMEPETESSVKNIVKKALVGTALAVSLSSDTHLFGQNAEANNKIFAFENRNWNQRAAGKSAAKTDFTDVSTVARLNDDLKEYYVQNPTVIQDLYKDRFGLPSFWPKRFGVIDMVQDAVMDIGNVTEARKPDWTPGVEFFIDAEKRKIYRIQIDLEFDGYQLQELETSWLASIYNFDGSSPYKNSFVAFLIKTKIDPQARLEDRIAAINAVYVEKPKGIKAKGHFLHRQNGLRYQIYSFISNKKIKPYISKVGKFSAANAYPYVKGMVEDLPVDYRKRLGLKFYMAPSNIVKVRESYKKIMALNNDYTTNVINYVEGYPNIEFEGLIDLEGSNVMFITDENNIEILEYLPTEKAVYRMETQKRMMFIHADYRTGCSFVFSGFVLPDNSNFLGQAQFIFVNDEPLFSKDFHVPIYGKAASAPLEITFNRLQVHAELISDVYKLEGLPKGTIVEILGNKNMVTPSVLKKKTSSNSGNLDLTADFNPKITGSVTLIVQADGTYKEVKRVSEFPTAPNSTFKFSVDPEVLDAYDGLIQKYEGSAPATLTEIVNGNEGIELTIYGSEQAYTVDNVDDKIVVNSVAVLNTDDKWITLKNFAGIWFEIARG